MHLTFDAMRPLQNVQWRFSYARDIVGAPDDVVELHRAAPADYAGAAHVACSAKLVGDAANAASCGARCTKRRARSCTGRPRLPGDRGRGDGRAASCDGLFPPLGDCVCVVLEVTLGPHLSHHTTVVHTHVQELRGDGQWPGRRPSRTQMASW